MRGLIPIALCSGVAKCTTGPDLNSGLDLNCGPVPWNGLVSYSLKVARFVPPSAVENSRTFLFLASVASEEVQQPIL
eukprot:1169552-Pleurochrysis_carterae.AAC.1